MIRSIQAAAIALTLIAPALAHAETAKVSVAYAPSALATAAGRAAIKANIAATADAYCRANPLDRTIAECRQNLVAQLTRTADVRAVQYAQAHPTVQMAQR